MPGGDLDNAPPADTVDSFRESVGAKSHIPFRFRNRSGADACVHGKAIRYSVAEPTFVLFSFCEFLPLHDNWL